MRVILGRIISAGFIICGWLLFGGRIMLDLIGYSTVPEDAEVAASRLSQAIDYLFLIPWPAVLGVVSVLTLALIWFSWQPGQPVTPIAGQLKGSKLRVSFNADLNPRILEADGAYRFYLHCVMATDQQTGVTRIAFATLFIAYNRPTDTGNVFIDFVGIKPTKWTILDRSEVSLIIDLTKDFGPCELVVSTSPGPSS